MALPGQTAGEKNGRFLCRGQDGAKTCSKCRQPKPLASFNVDLTRFDGRGYVCADCRAARRVKPGPTIRERRLQRAAGRQWCAGCTDWKGASEVRAAYCRPCTNRLRREHYANNDAFRFRCRQRAHARKRDVAPIPIEGLVIWEGYDGKCAYCGDPASTWDHVVAVANGGLTEPYNVVPACVRCNSSKHTRNVWAWLKETGREASDSLISQLTLYYVSLIPPKGPDPFE